MPTYEFRCPDGHTFDRFYRKMSDSVAELPCPECGKPAVRQLSGGAGLVFKGSGFYLTDYGKNAHRKGESANGGKPSGDSGSSGDKGESKSSETKSESKSEASTPKTAESKPASGSSSAPKSDK